MKSLFTFLLIIAVTYTKAQDIFAFQKERHTYNRELITNKVINQFTKNRFEKDYEYEANYLGSFTTNGRIFHLINSSYVHLKSLHNDNEIFIYNEQLQFVGYYNLATNYQLPTKLNNNRLFFKSNGCEEDINLSHGIPKHICLKCKGIEDCLEFK